jgi:hypothetical protein
VLGVYEEKGGVLGVDGEGSLDVEGDRLRERGIVGCRGRERKRRF